MPDRANLYLWAGLHPVHSNVHLPRHLHGRREQRSHANCNSTVPCGCTRRCMPGAGRGGRIVVKYSRSACMSGQKQARKSQIRHTSWMVYIYSSTFQHDKRCAGLGMQSRSAHGYVQDGAQHTDSLSQSFVSKWLQAPPLSMSSMCYKTCHALGNQDQGARRHVRVGRGWKSQEDI